MDYDPSKLLQIVSNLLSNALKFTPAGGAVTLAVELDGSAAAGWADSRQLTLKVRDTGIGIPEASLPYIFNHFYQVDNTSTRQGEGTGIGLALVRELVELAGGRITVTSQSGAGTEFCLQLPVTREAPAQSSIPEAVPPEIAILPRSAANSEAGALKSRETEADLPLLLIVEDNQDVVTYLRNCLEAQYQIRVAYDGQSGIHLATELIPDIIISDVMMPIKNGFEVCNELKQNEKTSHIPIIMLTAKDTFEDRIAGLERGADAYLSKPFNQKELLVRLRKLVELRRHLRERYRQLAPPAAAEGAPPEVAREDAFVEKARQANIRQLDNNSYTIDDLCKELAMSRMQLHRKLKALTNCSTSIFIRRIRLQRGRELLQTSGMNVSEVAYAVGFSDPKYFSRLFSQEYGIPPKELQRPPDEQP